MKISKLFHWLYAILMLLPFAFFVPSILYYAFNDNSTMQTVEVSITKTIAVDFNQLVPTLEYEETINGITCVSNDNGFYTLTGTYSEITLFSLTSFYAEKDNIYILRGGTSSCGINMYDSTIIGVNSIVGSGRFTALNSGYVTTGVRIALVGAANPVSTSFAPMIFNLTQMFGSGNEPTLEEFNSLFPLDYYPYNLGELMQITYDTGETEQLVSNTDIINYAWESIWDLPLFNWCKVSFVSVPFTYITGLFGLSASNSFNYVFTYFASMSIIWLVFDVIMYVPLLVHRWLDKGIVE